MSKCVMMVKFDHRRFQGEEVICEYSEPAGDSNDIFIENPMYIGVEAATEDSPAKLQMYPMLLFAQAAKIKISKTDILFTYVPKTELVNAYNQRTGRIITAPAGALDSKGQLIF